jgi:hypothetical protein
MTAEQIKTSIRDSIHSFSDGNLSERCIDLFEILGYITERRAPLDKPIFAEFKDVYIDGKKFDEVKAKTQEWKYVDLLFQLSKEEVLKQTSLFDTKQVDRTIIETYLFFTIELSNEQYSRTELSHITREVNRLFPMPVMILFKHGKTLTLSVINRRLHKKDENKDVLEKVTQIKEINIGKPHRAHIEILFDLSFDELKEKYQFTNFVELHNAWQKTLDTKELNKRFFNELANWYFWATQVVVFPDDAEKDKDLRNATGVIRLITRLMFVWFLKEKKLVPEVLFEETKLKQLLKYSDKNQSTFYKAILQNLFFATLNTEMGSRRFRIKSKDEKQRDGHHFIHNVFRYEDEFWKPRESLEKYFFDIPFLNGGLFECLDVEIELPNDKREKIRIDGFSDRNDNVLRVPDELFFSDKGKIIDLSEIYGTPKKSKEKVRGLIDILNSYKFTIAENTPIEEEVALDPELLGKVFENLLANYNPETQTTARKQTGSFYTPREIVNYMVDESLIAYLKTHLNDNDIVSEKLRNLLSYSLKEIKFSVQEKELLIKAIDSIKIIDPACGSGAFPMGILQKLVHILHILDPKNELWKQRQIEKANFIEDIPSREIAIEAIEEAFENNELDYGRKLYLIENCIYGVDIQPIAVQISKLRFFISLIVEQKININKENLGIRPLPNLETKFVAANTLIELEKENANLFTNPEIEKKKEQLKKIRHDYFEARTPKRKENCRNKDKQIRNELAELLVTNHDLQPATAMKVAKWNPYNQNSSASFFDLEWMYGLDKGFDIVIGNPPYLREKGNASFFQPVNESSFGKKYHQGKMDFWFYFLHKAIDITNTNGTISFITPRYWINSSGASNLIKRIKEKLVFINIVDIGKLNVFECVAGQHMISVYSRSLSEKRLVYKKLENDLSDISKTYNTENVSIKSLYNDDLFTEDNQINFERDALVLYEVVPLGDLYDVSQGVVEAVDRVSKKALENNYSNKFNVGDGVFVLSKTELDNLYLSSFEYETTIKKYLEPTDIEKYRISFSNNYLIYSDKEIKKLIEKKKLPNIKKHLDRFSDFITSSNKPYGLHRPREAKYFENEKIIFKGMFVSNDFCLDKEQYYVGMSFSVIIRRTQEYSLEYLLSILNSNFARYWFYKNSKHRGAGVDVGVEKLRTFLVKKNDKYGQVPFDTIVKYILLLKKKNQVTSFFERLLDAMVYELYLPDEVKLGGAEVIKFLCKLPELNEEQDGLNLKIIEKIHKELSDPMHPVSSALHKLLNIEVINIIEGRS